MQGAWKLPLRVPGVGGKSRAMRSYRELKSCREGSSLPASAGVWGEEIGLA